MAKNAKWILKQLEARKILKTGKHVIFLGAGASKGSGYPLANDLRLLISSKKKWEEALVQYEKKHDFVERPLTKPGMAYWDKHQEALELFRNGGFATIDEFCKLAGNFDFQREINGLRCLLRAALGMFNPEENFEKSEYYSFVQSLFKNDLLSLREDITVLTYNYDPYLEFLLFRALTERQRVVLRGKSAALDEEDIKKAGLMSKKYGAVTGGFYPTDGHKWLNDDSSGPSFCVLKLHGSICYYADDATSFQNLFLDDPARRSEKLFSHKSDQIIPPILFPWEMFGENGLSESDFFKHSQHRDLNQLFRSVWDRARREVQTADKISFVGLSMHSFLVDGLKYLFAGKEGKTEICVANPDNPTWVQGKRDTYWLNQPHCSAHGVGQILNEIAPKMGRTGKVPGSIQPEDGGLTQVNSFAEFIKTQMKPVLIN